MTEPEKTMTVESDLDIQIVDSSPQEEPLKEEPVKKTPAQLREEMLAENKRKRLEEAER
jgi:hypothetical protein